MDPAATTNSSIPPLPPEFKAFLESTKSSPPKEPFLKFSLSLDLPGLALIIIFFGIYLVYKNRKSKQASERDDKKENKLRE